MLKNADFGPSYGKYAAQSKLRISYTKTCMRKIKHATFRMYFPTLGPKRKQQADSFSFCQEVLELFPRYGNFYPCFRFERLCVGTYVHPFRVRGERTWQASDNRGSNCGHVRLRATASANNCDLHFFFRAKRLGAVLLPACHAMLQPAGAG